MPRYGPGMVGLRGARSAPAQCFHGEIARRSGRFIVVSDLQRTSKAEVWRESNRGERESIVREISREAPDFVAMLGDLVFRGSSASDWRGFEQLCSPLRDSGVPVLPVLGNHEYWVSRRAALARFFLRFPHLRGRHWYSIVYGPLGLVFLDSNRRWLPAAQWRDQMAWYQEELTRFERDPQILGILVLLHHPPYTNSTVTPDELHVQRAFVPPFLESGKTLAMLSGHVHSYERFERGGKTFVVTGGGGGPRVKLASGKRRRHTDELFPGPPLRPFHFLMLALKSSGLEAEVRGLPKRGREFELLERFTLSWAKQAAAP